jgi:hypothetical protein
LMCKCSVVYQGNFYWCIDAYSIKEEERKREICIGAYFL